MSGAKKGRMGRTPPSAGEKGRKPFPWGKILLEFFTVALGVFLGLLANQWREDHSDRVRGRRALAGVSLEIRTNRKILAKFHENNRAFLEAIGRKKDSPSPSYLPALQLESSSWNAFLSAGVSNAVDFEKIRLLSRVYSAQRVYTKSAGRLIGAALNMSAFAAAMGKKTENRFFQEEFRDYLEMLFKIEEELLASYKKVLDSLGGEGG